ncbi:MAG: DoxX family membrane protein [Proteobacteria bacterium]|nr:DoxX family membrane protein [Pseudomonadota bacterium]
MTATTSDQNATAKRGFAGKLGRGAVLGLRYFYGLFYLFAFVNKVQQGYGWTDYPKQVFLKQLAQIDQNGVMAAYLTGFLIPNYRLVGIVVMLVWAGVAVGLLLGLCTRWAGVLALFATVNIGLGGFYDASLIVLGLIALLFIVLPTGHWQGLDRRLHAKYPRSILFR